MAKTMEVEVMQLREEIAIQERQNEVEAPPHEVQQHRIHPDL